MSIEIFVNFKAYKEAAGKNALRLAEICSSVSEECRICIAVAPQHADIAAVSAIGVPVFCQHIDPVEKSGPYTGHAVAESMAESGAAGTFINHSERKMALPDIQKCIGIARKNNMLSLCCSATVEEAGSIAVFHPDFIAIEPPELIGGNVSVSSARPEVVVESVKAVKRINPGIKVLCGAGITCGEDVSKAVKLGVSGVLVASGIVKAKDPREALESLAAGMQI